MTDSGSLDPAQAANVSKAIAVLTAWIGQPELSFSKGVVVDMLEAGEGLALLSGLVTVSGVLLGHLAALGGETAERILQQLATDWGG
jgi:hypothetical protein